MSVCVYLGPWGGAREELGEGGGRRALGEREVNQPGLCLTHFLASVKTRASSAGPTHALGTHRACNHGTMLL